MYAICYRTFQAQPFECYHNKLTNLQKRKSDRKNYALVGYIFEKWSQLLVSLPDLRRGLVGKKNLSGKWEATHWNGNICVKKSGIKGSDCCFVVRSDMSHQQYDISEYMRQPVIIRKGAETWVLICILLMIFSRGLIFLTFSSSYVKFFKKVELDNL